MFEVSDEVVVVSELMTQRCELICQHLTRRQRRLTLRLQSLVVLTQLSNCQSFNQSPITIAQRHAAFTTLIISPHLISSQIS